MNSFKQWIVAIFRLNSIKIVFIKKLSDACHHSVQNHLSSSLLSNNIEIKICRSIILLVL